MANGILIGSLVMAIGFLVLASGVGAGRTADNLRNWQATRGQVEAEFVSTRFGSLFGYNYQVGEANFRTFELVLTSGIWRFDWNDTRPIESAQLSIAAAHRLRAQQSTDRGEGTTALVRYNPANPSEATIQPEYYLAVNKERKVTIGLVVMLFGAIILIVPGLVLRVIGRGASEDEESETPESAHAPVMGGQSGQPG